jgi:hypothetical protein
MMGLRMNLVADVGDVDGVLDVSGFTGLFRGLGENQRLVAQDVFLDRIALLAWETKQRRLRPGTPGAVCLY